MNDSAKHSDAEDWISVALPIPRHWVYADFEHVIENISLNNIKIPQKEYLASGRYPVIDQGARLVGGYTDATDKVVSDDRAMIIFGDHTKCFKYVSFPFAPGADGIKALRPKYPINEKYAYYACLSLRLPDRGYSRHYSFLKKSKFPLPPVGEQGRIVSKIEELFSELDKGVESLKTARKQLKVYRQALLKNAFEGKLTAQWREQNKDKLQTADQLLARIRSEREIHYQQQLEEWKAAVKNWEAKGRPGKKPSKPRAVRYLPEFSQDDLAILPTPSTGWTWVKIDRLCEHGQSAIKAGPFGSSLKKEFYTPSGYKIYGQEQVISGDPRFGDYFISESKFLELESCKIKPADILISLVGTVGKILILPEDVAPGIINPRLIKFSPNTKIYNPAFFKYYFESSFVRGLYKARTHGATMDVMNLSILQSLPFPLCSLEKQAEIVDEVAAIDSEIENLESSIETQSLVASSLRQSILKKAFSGQLVEQYLNDEPASVLLERIRAEEASRLARSPKRKPRRINEHVSR